MYDLAKRSLAFAVATGGLLLTATAYSPALAAMGSDAANQGQAQVLNVQNGAGHASAAVNAAPQGDAANAGSPGREVQAPPRPLAPEPPAAGPGSGASAVSDTGPPGPLVSGDDVKAPSDAPAGACGDTADVVAGTDEATVCTNTAEGSAPTMPGDPAAGSGGASATAVSVDNGGSGADTAVNAPPDAPSMHPSPYPTQPPCDCAPPSAPPSAPPRPHPTQTPCHCAPPAPHPHPHPHPHPTKPSCHCAPPAPHRPPPPPPPSTGWCGPCSQPSPPPSTHWSPPAPPSSPPTKSGCPCSHSPSAPPSGPPSHGPSSPPSGPPSHGASGPPHGGGGGLAHTGADIGIALGVAGAALLAGLGLRAVAAKREGDE